LKELEAILSVKGLYTYFDTPRGLLRAVDGVSFDVFKGESLGIVGESGCGKSVTALSILRLVQKPGKIVSGEMNFLGKNLVTLPEKEIRHIRGNQIAMVFQEPLSSLNPCFSIGWQIQESYKLHSNLDKTQIRKRTIEILEKVRIPDPEKRVNDYPHHFSGGMRQRVLIAIALACEPKILIADEPTTALDVTVQADIMDLLDDLKEDMNLTTILISHNLNLVGERCGRIIVMYSGRVVEICDSTTLFRSPAHPYTRGLLKAIPRNNSGNTKLISIPGEVSEPVGDRKGCAFYNRCSSVKPICANIEPELNEVEKGHFCRCHYHF
jgi:peptide/nickel transport system ATP-binding protein